MSASALLIAAVFSISLVLTMVGLGGGLLFSPLFVLLGLAKSQAASASLFLNLAAAASAAYTYARRNMVDFSLCAEKAPATRCGQPLQAGGFRMPLPPGPAFRRLDGDNRSPGADDGGGRVA